MTEMLGNRYFLARQFEKAVPCFERALNREASSINIKKKLVVCYIELGQIERAFGHFKAIVNIDPHLIIDTDLYYDDCPCCELIPSWEKKLNQGGELSQVYKVLGMLYLYCDLEKSIYWLKLAADADQQPSRITSILNQLSSVSA